MKLEVGFKGLCAFVRNNADLGKVTLSTVLMVTSVDYKHVPVLAIRVDDLKEGQMPDEIVETAADWSKYKVRLPESWALWHLTGREVTLKARNTTPKVTFEKPKHVSLRDWAYVVDLGTASKPICRKVDPTHLGPDAKVETIAARVRVHNGHFEAGASDQKEYKFERSKHVQFMADFALLTVDTPQGVEITLTDYKGGNKTSIQLKGDTPRLFFSNLPRHLEMPSNEIPHFKAYWQLPKEADCKAWNDMPVVEGRYRVESPMENAVPIACPPVDLGP